MKPNHTGPASETTLKSIAERNAARIEAARQQMGTRYLLHPANQVARKAQNVR